MATQTATEIKLTDLEKEFLSVFDSNEVSYDESVYFCRLYDWTGIDERQAAGVSSSLVKKGILIVAWAGTFDHSICLTEFGEEVFLNLYGER